MLSRSNSDYKQSRKPVRTSATAGNKQRSNVSSISLQLYLKTNVHISSPNVFLRIGQARVASCNFFLGGGILSF